MDAGDELLVYPVIFPPMAYLLKEFSKVNISSADRAAIQRKITKWFVGAILTRRYQQSTHDKQARDKTEMKAWLAGGDEPDWLKQAVVPSLRASDPDSAIGKLIRALMNHSGVKDPITSRQVGVGSGREQGQKHHIFPTKFVTHLEGWRSLKNEDSNNIAVNIMYVEQSTNATWLNLDPALQINQATKARGSEQAVRDIYLAHGISSQAFDLLKKQGKTAKDFYDFIEMRETYFVQVLGKQGFNVASASQPMLESEFLDE